VNGAGGEGAGRPPPSLPSIDAGSTGDNPGNLRIVAPALGHQGTLRERRRSTLKTVQVAVGLADMLLSIEIRFA
jgi:hypothetical protein